MIIVTGGAGFIGSAVVSKLNETGHSNIIIVDSLGKSEKWKNLRNLNYQDYFEKDVFLSKILKNDFEESKIKCVIHMGACSSTTETDCRYLIDNNYEYTKILADYCVSNEIRFIYASSAATYGDGSLGYSDDENNIEKLQPLNMYGYSKQMFDLYAKKNGILDKIVGLKFFNVFGPNEYHKEDMRSIVHKAFYQIREKGEVNLFKSYKPEYQDGEQKRDFIYVKDAVEKLLFFINDYNINGIFNIGSGEACSWNRLITAVFNAMNKPVKIKYIDMPDYLKEKYQYFTQADMTKFNKVSENKNIQNWKLEDAVNDYVSYLENERYL